jgi:DNA invertase Pin-like site-specific DNA recombinase
MPGNGKKKPNGKKPAKKNGGRPKKAIDEAQVRLLASYNCSYAEIAAVVKCDPSTLTRRFAQVIKEGREEGKASLKRVQYKKAMEGGPRFSMAGRWNTGTTIWQNCLTPN